MSSKYDVPVIRTEVIDHLKCCFATEMRHLSKCELKDLFCESTSSDGTPIAFDAEEFVFQLLDVAVRTNALILLPVIYYEFSALPLVKISTLSAKFSLDREVIDKILSAHEKFMKLSYIFGTKILSPRYRCNSAICTEARPQIFFEWMNCATYKLPEFPKNLISKGLKAFGSEELRGRMCVDCVKKSNAATSEFVSVFWHETPRILGLGSWETLKRD